MAKAKKKRKHKNNTETKPGNTIMSVIQKEDCKRLRDRVVKPEKGKGRKDRPRDKNWDDPSFEEPIS